MAISYSLHLGNSSNSIRTLKDLQKVSKHNLRRYKEREEADIEVLRGSSEAIDIARIFHEEFDEALLKYNQKVRKDRQIEDYLKHVDESKYDLCCELIIQVGNKDFFSDISKDKQKELVPLFEAQLQKLEELLPGFKIASAVAHFDEHTPHLHVVGVPIQHYEKGLSKRVSKSKVFTRDSLAMLQREMRKACEEEMQHIELFNQVELKEKELGHSKWMPKEVLEEFYALKKRIEELRSKEEKDVGYINELVEYYNKLLEQVEETEREIKRSREIEL